MTALQSSHKCKVRASEGGSELCKSRGHNEEISRAAGRVLHAQTGLCMVCSSPASTDILHVGKGACSLLVVTCALQLVLCGQTPEVIADSALYAINFYIEQQRLSGMYLNHQLKQKMAIIQTQCKEKLMQMQHAYQQVSVPAPAHRAVL